MSEREEVLTYFGWQTCVMGDECCHDECRIPVQMADEIVRLRSQLAAAESIAQAREVLIAALRADKDEARSMLTTAERERDEARRERDRLQQLLGLRMTHYDGMKELAERMEQERDQFASMLHDCENERDGWKHRAERAERAIRGLRDAYNDQRSDQEKDAAWIAAMQVIATTPTRGSDE